ncbi:MAG: twin-arginine translocation signal domain-containing protein [Pseudomonadota bacterium]
MKKMDRRQFIKSGLAAGVALGGLPFIPTLTAGAATRPDISVATGSDVFAAGFSIWIPKVRS